MSRITSLVQLDLNKRYTYADYLTWEVKERIELIKGKILKMAPAPNRKHQRISLLLERAIDQFLAQMPCELYHAPFDVRLPLPLNKQSSERFDTVVQPDIVVVCDTSKLDEQGCNGAPELIIEILSPGNTQREMKDKFELYEAAGVQEYWLVDPIRETTILYHRNAEDRFVGTRPFLAGDTIQSKVLEGFSIEASVFLNEN